VSTNERVENLVIGSKNMNRSALKREDLCASFEPYSNLVSGVVASLSLKKMYLMNCPSPKKMKESEGGTIDQVFFLIFWNEKKLKENKGDN